MIDLRDKFAHSTIIDLKKNKKLLKKHCELYGLDRKGCQSIPIPIDRVILRMFEKVRICIESLKK